MKKVLMGLHLLLPLALIITFTSTAGNLDIGKEQPSVVYIHRASASGMSQLMVDDSLLNQTDGKSVVFRLRGLWKYDPETNTWERVTKEHQESMVLTPGDSIATAKRVLSILPEQIGLYWVVWSENKQRVSKKAFSGPIACNDVMLGTSPPKGMIAACIPFTDHASAALVPDPEICCTE